MPIVNLMLKCATMMHRLNLISLSMKPNKPGVPPILPQYKENHMNNIDPEVHDHRSEEDKIAFYSSLDDAQKAQLKRDYDQYLSERFPTTNVGRTAVKPIV